jgi:hypothetical protein
VKERADNVVIGYYGLIGLDKDALKLCVEELLDDDRYVFATEPNVSMSKLPNEPAHLIISF